MDLRRFRVDADPVDAPAPRDLSIISPSMPARILSFDQSIRKVGWSISVCSPPSTFEVERTGMIRTTKVFSSHRDTLISGEQILDEVLELIRQTSPSRICHEMPIVGGGRYVRPDAALVSGMAIRAAARHFGVPVSMWSANTVKGRLTGDFNADKKKVRAAIDSMLPRVAHLRPRNEDTYDSIGLAIVEAEEGAGHG